MVDPPICRDDGHAGVLCPLFWDFGGRGHIVLHRPIQSPSAHGRDSVCLVWPKGTATARPKFWSAPPPHVLPASRALSVLFWPGSGFSPSAWDSSLLERLTALRGHTGGLSVTGNGTLCHCSSYPILTGPTRRAEYSNSGIGQLARWPTDIA